MTIDENSPTNSLGEAPSRNKLPPLKNLPSTFLKGANEGGIQLRSARQSLASKLKESRNSLRKSSDHTKKIRANSFNFVTKEENYEMENDHYSEQSEGAAEISPPRIRIMKDDSQRWNCSEEIFINGFTPTFVQGQSKESSFSLKTPEKVSDKESSICVHSQEKCLDSRLSPKLMKMRFKFNSIDMAEKRPVKPSNYNLRVIICYRGYDNEAGYPERWIEVPRRGLYKFDVVNLIDPEANQNKIVMENASWIVLSRVSTQTKLLYLKLYSCITAILLFLPMDHNKKKYPEVNIHIPLKGMSKADFCTLLQPAEDPDDLVVEGWNKTFTSLDTFDVYSIDWIVRDERVVMLSRRQKRTPKLEELPSTKFHQLRLAFSKRIRQMSS